MNGNFKEEMMEFVDKSCLQEDTQTFMIKEKELLILISNFSEFQKQSNLRSKSMMGQKLAVAQK